MSGICKIIAKILANRLKTVLEKIILKLQNACIWGRQILDHVHIANKCLDSRMRSGELCVLCKLVLEKAYDHVDWDFLLYMLWRCGFGVKWCPLIAYCISIVQFSVLVNDSTTIVFSSSSGLRQGTFYPFCLSL